MPSVVYKLHLCRQAAPYWRGPSAHDKWSHYGCRLHKQMALETMETPGGRGVSLPTMRSVVIERLFGFLRAASWLVLP